MEATGQLVSLLVPISGPALQLCHSLVAVASVLAHAFTIFFLLVGCVACYDAFGQLFNKLMCGSYVYFQCTNTVVL